MVLTHLFFGLFLFGWLVFGGVGVALVQYPSWAFVLKLLGPTARFHDGCWRMLHYV